MMNFNLMSRREFYGLTAAFVGGAGASFIGRRALSSRQGDSLDPSAETLYRAKLEGFRAAPGERSLILVGDSHVDIGEWPALLGRPATNRGIPGDTTVGLSKRLPEVLERQPKIAVLQIGVNDLSHKESPKAVAHRRQEIRRRLSATGARVISLAIFHVGKSRSWENGPIDETNEILRKTLPAGVEWLDVNQALDLAPSLQEDDLHLSATGYRVLARELAIALDG